MTRKTLFSSSILIGFGLLATACSSADIQDANPLTLGHWKQLPAQEEISVELVSMDHPVTFTANAVRPSEPERRRMLDFLDNNQITSTDEIEFGAATALDGSYDPVTVARLEALEDEFLQLGLPASISRDPAVIARGSADRITIMVYRAVAIPPDCSVPQPGFADRPDWKVGCSVKASLGHMVANPRDLARGRPLGPADAEAVSRPVKGYRNPEASEDKPLFDALKAISEATSEE